MVDELWAGRYRRDRLLGHGAMGDVWAAFDVVLDRPVAIKSISDHRTDPDDQQRMAREARVAARIGHPNAVAVHDLLVVDGRPNLVMEYVEGDTLADRIKRGGRIDPRHVAALGAAVADALAEAHRLGITHRDIKPANILITPRGVPKLADFGIARVSGDANMTATGMMVGTPAYMAPEIVHGEPADERSDVWSLGVTLYAALEGAPPFVTAPHDEPMAVLGRVLHAPIRPPSCGGALARTVSAMLDRDPARRPSAREASGLLRGAQPSQDALGTTALPAAGAGTTQVRAPRPPDPPAWSQTRADPRPEPEPVLPGTWSTSGSSGGYPPYDDRRRSRTGPVIAVVAVVLLLVGAATAGLLLYRSRNDGSPVVASDSGLPSTSSRPAAGPSSPSPVITTITVSAGPTATPTNTPTAGAGDTTYSGPGGETVVGPAGWTLDTSGGNPHIVDYDAPASAGLGDTTSFQIGIGHEPSISIQGEASGARNFLRKKYADDLSFVTTFGTYLGDDAVTLEYTGTSKAYGPRHGIERLWVHDGATYEIILSGPADSWDQAQPVFDQLVESARVAD